MKHNIENQVDYKANQQPAALNGNTFADSLFNKPVEDKQNIGHQEEEILGFILNNNEFAQTIFEQLTINHFNYKLHCIIFEAAKHLFDNGKSTEYLAVSDFIILNKSKYKGLYDFFSPDPLNYLVSLVQKTSIKNINSFNSRIKHLEINLLAHEITQALNNHDFEKVAEIATRKSLNSSNKASFSLKQFGLTSKLEDLEMRAKEEVFVLKDIALTGQITAIYAPPNIGKTLITLRLISEGIARHGLNPENIIYINVDDTNKGLREKIAIAKEFGFEMITDNEAGFKIKELTKFLQMAINNNDCNEIIILDTLKKVVDLMDKKASSEFMKVARNYVQKGGTIILLGHTNKNKGADGKHKYGGTSDIVDDCDCAYIASLLSEDETFKTIVFENNKVRGTNELEVVFKYRKRNQGYLELIQSVETITNGEIENAKKQNELNEIMAKDKPTIDAIKSALESLKEGDAKKTDIINLAKDAPNTSRRKVDECLGKYINILWSCEKGGLNTFLYKLII